MSESPDPSETCNRAAQAAAEVLAENCPESDFQIRALPREQMRERALTQLGLFEDDLEPDCERLIERGFDQETCSTNPTVQQLVFCMVFEGTPGDDFNQPLLDVFGGDLDAALEQAFRLHRRECEGT